MTDKLFSDQSPDWRAGFRTASLLHAKVCLACAADMVAADDQRSARVLTNLALAIAEITDRHVPEGCNPELN